MERLQMKIWRFLIISFRFRNGKAKKVPHISLALTFVMIMLGTHKPQQQATLMMKHKKQKPRDALSLPLL